MEIDTFACTMFAHVKANGVTVQQSNSDPDAATNTRMQTSETFLEQGSARRTEFYYHNNPDQAVDNAEQTTLSSIVALDCDRPRLVLPEERET